MKPNELLDRLVSLGIASLTCAASGSGDEGCVGDVFCEDSGGNTVATDEDLQAAVEEMFDMAEFNFSDGQGGELALKIDVATRAISWEGLEPVMEVTWEKSEVIE
jgi:hypothetical protein